MKVVFLIKEVDYSGAPKMLVWVANQMENAGHNVTIMAMYSDKCLQPIGDNVRFISLGLSQSRNRAVRNTIGMVKAVGTVHKAMKKESPDVVVTFLDSVGYVYMLKNKFSTKYKVLASERSDPYAQRGLTGKIRQKLFSLADAIVFQTEGARDFFGKNKKIQSKSCVIPNPIIPKVKSEKLPIVEFNGRDNRIVSVGRLALRQKRHDVMIDAFKIVHDKHPEITLHIYGDGADKEKIQNYINEKGLSNSVFLMGRTDNVERDIYNAKAFLLTSDFEGIPNALIEAMLAGVPSVSTDCSPGGASLLINNEKNGLLVPCGDVDAISNGIVQLVENAELSNRVSQNAPLILNQFSEECVREMWFRCFERIEKKDCRNEEIEA